MSSKIKLSYIITTFNKIDYLKLVIESLIPFIKEDEEVVVVDGASKDGTSEYLQKLRRECKIHKFISENDKGEAHGFNKAILLSEGELIKILTDDDAFDHSVIQKCKDFMLLHPEIDVLGGNTGTVSLENKNSLFLAQDFEDDFFKWKEGKLKNFFFNGTCLMIRRSSLALTGLFNTAGLLTDMEYSLRVTSVANLAWCSGIVSVRILNPQSNNLVFKHKSLEESDRLCLYYNYKYPWDRKTDEQKKRSVYKKVRSFAAKILKMVRKSEKKLPSVIEPFSSFDAAHEYCINWMKGHSLNKEITFITGHDNK